MKQMKHLLAFAMLVVFCIVSSSCWILPCNSGAYDPDICWEDQIEKGGKIFQDLRYKEDNGTIRIIRYEGKGGAVTIPEKIINKPVTIIGEHAFRQTKLTDIVIPNTVISIEDHAFENNKLTDVKIPDSIISIGKCAFYNNKLVSVNIPESVTFIGDFAFCSNQLTNIVIPESITSIKTNAFTKNKLISVIIPNSITNIGSYAFSQNQLASIVIPDSVIKIEYGAFSYNPLTSISIGVDVDIGRSLFDLWNDNFTDVYNNGGRQAGTYTRPDTESSVWTRE